MHFSSVISWARRLIKFLWSVIQRYYPPFFLSFFIFLAVLSIMHDYGQLGTMEGIDSIWQFIGFTFVLATLLLTADKKVFSSGQGGSVSRVGYIFVLAGMSMIFGFGMAVYGYGNQDTWLREVFKKAGIGVYVVSIYGVCYGIAEMGIQAAKKLFQR